MPVYRCSKMRRYRVEDTVSRKYCSIFDVVLGEVYIAISWQQIEVTISRYHDVVGYDTIPKTGLRGLESSFAAVYGV